tara:strand:+ start:4965 stop:5066 length:102 start_codon:yes stop_codon:yes gene_type:complete
MQIHQINRYSHSIIPRFKALKIECFATINSLLD